MLKVESLPPVAEELELIIKRLNLLRESLANLGDEFGIHLDHPEHAHADRDRKMPGIDQFRTAVTEINTQIAYIEQERDRLFAARAQLFGLGDPQWQDAPNPTPTGHGPIQPGNYRSHP